MSELKTLQSISRGKPDGATHASSEPDYFKRVIGNQAAAIKWQKWDSEDKRWYPTYATPDRSLADIEKQIDQLKEIDGLKTEKQILLGHILRLSEKYADLKIKSDANEWAHDNMKEQLASAKIPTTFWDADQGDGGYCDVRDLFEDGITCNTKIGFQMEVGQSASLPNAIYRLTQLNDDGTFEIEEVLEGKG
jgi:hypothetical protein